MSVGVNIIRWKLLPIVPTYEEGENHAKLPGVPVPLLGRGIVPRVCPKNAVRFVGLFTVGVIGCAGGGCGGVGVSGGGSGGSCGGGFGGGCSYVDGGSYDNSCTGVVPAVCVGVCCGRGVAGSGSGCSVGAATGAGVDCGVTSGVGVRVGEGVGIGAGTIGSPLDSGMGKVGRILFATDE